MEDIEEEEEDTEEEEEEEEEEDPAKFIRDMYEIVPKDMFKFGSEIPFGNKYKIRFVPNKLYMLGYGYYGLVFKGWDIKKEFDDKPEYAVKIMYSRVLEDGPLPTTVKELALLKLCSDTNIIGFNDVYAWNMKEVLSGGDKDFSSIVMVMNLMDTDLCHLLEKNAKLIAGNKKKRVIKNHVVRERICVQMSRALLYLHKANIIHRDLKPANFLIKKTSRGDVNEPYCIKLADFGLARDVSSPTIDWNTGAITPGYRPPEMFLEFADYSSAVDVFSLGCIFFEVYTHCPLLLPAYPESFFEWLYRFSPNGKNKAKQEYINLQVKSIFRVFGLEFPWNMATPERYFRIQQAPYEKIDEEYAARYSPYRTYLSSGRLAAHLKNMAGSVSSLPTSGLHGPPTIPFQVNYLVDEKFFAKPRTRGHLRDPFADIRKAYNMSPLDYVLNVGKLPIDDFEVLQWFKMCPRMLELIEGMVQINPVHRFTMDQVVARLREIGWMSSSIEG